MARIIGNFQDVIERSPMPMSSEEVFYEADTGLKAEIYIALGAYMDSRLVQDLTITEFDLVLGLSGSRTVRYKCSVAIDPDLRTVDTTMG